MEPENIDWDKIDSIFIEDEKYENFEAPKWVDLSALDKIPVVDDEAWFCNHDCKHPKTAEDFLKPKTATTSKSKLLRLVTISEILPFRDRNRRENYSATEGFYAKLSDKSRRLSCSGNFHDEDNENKNPNFSAPIPSGSNRINKPKKPLLRSNKENPKQLNNVAMECSAKSSEKKSQLKSTFSAQNLLGGREILSQISGFCSELKRLVVAKKGKGTYKKGVTEKGQSQNGVSEEEGKMKDTALHKERGVPLLEVKEKKGTTLNKQ